LKLKLKNQIAKWFWFVLRPFDYAQDKRAYRVLRIAYVGTDLNGLLGFLCRTLVSKMDHRTVSKA